MTICVSQSKIVDKNTGIERPCKYSDIPKDIGNWVHDLNYRPIPFDLLELKIKDSCKVKGGWWDGKEWQGVKLKPQDEVIAWKRQLYDYALG